MKTENNSRHNPHVPFFAKKQDKKTLVIKTGLKAGACERPEK